LNRGYYSPVQKLSSTNELSSFSWYIVTCVKTLKWTDESSKHNVYTSANKHETPIANKLKIANVSLKLFVKIVKGN